jgi:hypothetical protein
MVQVLNSAQDFELFGGRALAPSGRALKNSKARAILGRCVIFSPATAVFGFKVSPVVASRRALDLRLVSHEEFFDFYERYTDRELSRRPESSGGDFYNTQNTREGEFFVTRGYHAAMEGRIGFKAAYDLTGLRDGTFQRYVKQVRGGH